jgi:hypothetical protein
MQKGTPYLAAIAIPLALARVTLAAELHAPWR